jgi:hypothetical protein
MATSPLIGPTDADMMLLRLDDRMRIMEQTATMPPGVVAFVPNGQPSTLVWNTLTPAANWAHYASPYGPMAYSKDANGIVRLRGLASWAQGVAPQVMGTLPTGFRPLTTHMLRPAKWGAAQHGVVRIEVALDGTITPSEWFGTAAVPDWTGYWVSLSDINFDSGTPLLTTSAGATIPDGWLFADGSTISAARYGQLVARLKTTTLPDLRGAAPLGTVPIIKF